VEKRLEPEQLLAIADDLVAYRLPVARPETLAESGLHFVVFVELVNDLVT
jgi:hypothetical protein